MDELLQRVLDGAAKLDIQRAERGMAEGRWSSTPVSRRAPVDLDAVVLTDRRTGIVAVLHRWADRVRAERGIAVARRRVGYDGALWFVQGAPTLESESRLLSEHWQWATEQSWGGEMTAELAGLLEAIEHGGRKVRLILCPVCDRPVRADTFARDHRACLDVPVI